MTLYLELNKYLSYGGNPFFRIRQNPKGSLFGMFLDPALTSQGVSISTLAKY